MRVNSIDNGTQFNGYVDKSVIKYVDKAVKARCYEIAYSYAQKKQPVNIKEIKEAQETGTVILNQLDKFMNKLEAKTGLYVDKRPDTEHYNMWSGYPTMLTLELRNPAAKNPVVVATSTGNNSSGTAKPLYYGLFRNYDCEFATKALKAMKDLTDWVTGKQHGFYDEKVLEAAVGELSSDLSRIDDLGFFKRRKLLNRTNLAEIYLTDIGKKNSEEYTFARAKSIIRDIRDYFAGKDARKEQERINRKVVQQQLKK